MIKISSFIFFLFFSFCTNANSLTLAEVYEIALNKDPELKIGDLIGNVNILGMIRLKVGEDIVVEKKDFADEVADQLK